MDKKQMTMLGNPAHNNWCVLLESRQEDGATKRFLSFHWSRDEAELVKKALEADYSEDPDFEVSVTQYRYRPSVNAAAELAFIGGIQEFMKGFNDDRNN